MPSQNSNLVKVAVAFLDGRRIKGYTLNFSPQRNCFDLLPQENPLQQRGARVDLSDVKAVFFVKDFAGDPTHHDSLDPAKQGYGRKMEIVLADGERVVGTTPGYDPQSLGFFLVPSDPNSNNARIFIVNGNTRQIKPA
jgi:hypothetical protein